MASICKRSMLVFSLSAGIIFFLLAPTHRPVLLMESVPFRNGVAERKGIGKKNYEHFAIHDKNCIQFLRSCSSPSALVRSCTRSSYFMHTSSIHLAIHSRSNDAVADATTVAACYGKHPRNNNKSRGKKS